MIHLKRMTSDKSGFTIVELMVATLVFAIILVVITSGIIHFTADYYKGVNTSATQTAARNIANIIAQNLQYGGGQDVYDGSHAAAGYICVGATRIDYNLGYELTANPISSSNYAIVVSADDCSTATFPSAAKQPKEYLGPHMRVTNLKITRVLGVTNNLYKISIGVAYGDPDLLCARNIPATNPGGCAPTQSVPATASFWTSNGAFIGCKGITGSEYCAAARLNTEVVSRFGLSS
ncbi:MAG TPA: prepilin-type N-terminal cleavage/methylation domain-containing protein [Candidatus Microsaccharimonas sp.]|nr:prepilin-type N-terminal cleavage/methylation domain-containing protein [Candidatus Microsaccharimonas sp.]